MRVAIIVYALDRPLSGISRYAMELTRSLADLPRGNEMELFTAGSQFPLTKELDLHNISLPGCRLLPGLITVGNGLIPLVACRRGLDIVHDPTGVTPFLFGAGGARTVVTVHDVFAWSCPGTSTFLDTIIYRHWLPRVLPTVDAVITVSQVSKGDITRYLNIPTSKIRIIYEGVSGAYHPLPAGKVTRIAVQHGLPGNYILFVGSVEKRKNLRGLLQAYAHLRTMGEPPPLVVVGARRGRGNGITETLREHDLKPHVVFLGYVPDEDLPALYSGADLFVFPSHYEGFGLPPLEAMACGTPVVCSNTSSLPEVVGDAAIMVDPTNVEALAEAMHRVLTDGDLRQHMREKGLARAKQFTWERCARETLAVYQEVCG